MIVPSSTCSWSTGLWRLPPLVTSLTGMWEVTNFHLVAYLHLCSVLKYCSLATMLISFKWNVYVVVLILISFIAQGSSKPPFLNGLFNLHGHQFQFKADFWRSWGFGDTLAFISQEPLCWTESGQVNFLMLVLFFLLSDINGNLLSQSLSQFLAPEHTEATVS